MKNAKPGETVITVRMTEKQKEQLKLIGERRYRKASMSDTVRFLIEDVGKEIEGAA